jgi:hypothetical protein
MSDDDRPRKSWREIDRGRDGSQHRREAPARTGGQPRRGGVAAAQSQSHKALLDKLFTTGAIADYVKQRNAQTALPGEAEAEPSGPSRRALGQAVLDATSRPARIQAVDAYVDAFGYAADYEHLTAFLQHPDREVQEQTLAALESKLALEKPKHGRTLVAELRSLAELGDWPDLRARAEALVRRLI